MKRYAPVIGALCAAVLAVCAVLIVHSATTEWPATFPNPHQNPYGTTGFMILFGPLLTLWGTTAFLRCSDSTVRRNLAATTLLLLFWMFVALIKYAARMNEIVMYASYAYAIPLAFLPLLVLFNALRISALERSVTVRGLERVLVVVAILLCILSFTNNLHHLFFIFDFTDPHWDLRYTVGPVYWSLFIWAAGLPTIALFVIVARARPSLRVVAVLVAAIGIVSIAFGVSYALRRPQLVDSNIALIYTVFSVTLFELCMQSGILPSCMRFESLFAELPFDLKLLVRSKSGQLSTALQTDAATPLHDEEAEPVLQTKEGETSRFKLDVFPDAIYRAYHVRGGYALLNMNAALINAERRQLEMRQEMLKQQNELLEHANEIQRRLMRQQRERELYEDVEDSLREATEHITRLIETLPSGESDEDRARRKRQLQLVKLLVAYCKRKGSLVLANKGGVDFDRDRLMVIINEITADMRTTGAECAAIVEIDRPLPAGAVNTLYDSLYDFLIIALAQPNPVIMIFIRTNDAESIDVRASMESDISDDVGTGAPVLADFDFSTHDLPYTLDAEQGSLRLTARIDTREVES